MLAGHGKKALPRDPPKPQHHKCHICGKVFKGGHLARHLRSHARFKCQFCPLYFTRTKILMKHLKVHGVKDPQALLNASKPEPGKNRSSNRPYAYDVTECLWRPAPDRPSNAKHCHVRVFFFFFFFFLCQIWAKNLLKICIQGGLKKPASHLNWLFSRALSKKTANRCATRLASIVKM